MQINSNEGNLFGHVLSRNGLMLLCVGVQIVNVIHDRAYAFAFHNININSK